MRTVAATLMALHFLTACGMEHDAQGNGGADQQVAAETVTENKTPEPQALLVQTESELPACDTEGLLIYIVDAAEFRACHKGEWNVIDIAGQVAEKKVAVEAKQATEQAAVTAAKDPKFKLISANRRGDDVACPDRYRLPVESDSVRAMFAAVQDKMGLDPKGPFDLRFWIDDGLTVPLREPGGWSLARTPVEEEHVLICVKQ